MNTDTVVPSLPVAQGGTARRLGALCLGLAGLLSVASAQAGDVYWSVGVQSPGAVVELANAPRVVYGAPPVVYVPASVYRSEWAPYRYQERKHWKHHHRRDWRDDDRRWDDGDRRGGYYRDDRRWRDRHDD